MAYFHSITHTRPQKWMTKIRRYAYVVQIPTSIPMHTYIHVCIDCCDVIYSLIIWQIHFKQSDCHTFLVETYILPLPVFVDITEQCIMLKRHKMYTLQGVEFICVYYIILQTVLIRVEDSYLSWWFHFGPSGCNKRKTQRFDEFRVIHIIIIIYNVSWRMWQFFETLRRRTISVKVL